MHDLAIRLHKKQIVRVVMVTAPTKNRRALLASLQLVKEMSYEVLNLGRGPWCS